MSMTYDAPKRLGAVLSEKLKPEPEIPWFFATDEEPPKETKPEDIKRELLPEQEKPEPVQEPWPEPKLKQEAPTKETPEAPKFEFDADRFVKPPGETPEAKPEPRSDGTTPKFEFDASPYVGRSNRSTRGIFGQEKTQGFNQQIFPVDLVRVIDGDTFEAKVKINGVEHTVKIRLKDVDAPELGPGGMGQRERAALASVLKGPLILWGVHFDPNTGRYEANVKSGSSENVSKWMLDRGYAKSWMGKPQGWPKDNEWRKIWQEMDVDSTLKWKDVVSWSQRFGLMQSGRWGVKVKPTKEQLDQFQKLAKEFMDQYVWPWREKKYGKQAVAMMRKQLQQPQTTPTHPVTNRPVLNNPDGSISTEETITIGGHGVYYNIPTIVDGKRVSPEVAERLMQNGKNPPVGVFRTLEDAVRAAKQRSEMLGRTKEETEQPFDWKKAGYEIDRPSGRGEIEAWKRSLHPKEQKIWRSLQLADQYYKANAPRGMDERRAYFSSPDYVAFKHYQEKFLTLTTRRWRQYSPKKRRRG